MNDPRTSGNADRYVVTTDGKLVPEQLDALVDGRGTEDIRPIEVEVGEATPPDLLDSLTALDLRGYATLDARFGPGAHLIVGPNAAGKVVSEGETEEIVVRGHRMSDLIGKLSFADPRVVEVVDVVAEEAPAAEAAETTEA